MDAVASEAGEVRREAGWPSTLVSDVLSLQRSAGNQAVLQHLGHRPPRPVLARLRTGRDRDADIAYARSKLDGMLPLYVSGQRLTEHEKALISDNAADLVADAMKADEQMMVKHGVATLTARETRKEPVAKQRELWKRFPLKKGSAKQEDFDAERRLLEEEAARAHAELLKLLPWTQQLGFAPELATWFSIEEKSDAIDWLAGWLQSIESRKSERVSGGATDSPWRKPAYWREKGQALLQAVAPQIRIKPDWETLLGTLDQAPAKSAREWKELAANKAPLWCDQSTAIILSTLGDDPAFKSSLEVVKQGDPKQHGHWYVVANRDPAQPAPAYGRALPADAFLIDIWGAVVMRERGENQNTAVFEALENSSVFDASVVDEANQPEEFARQNVMEIMLRLEQKA